MLQLNKIILTSYKNYFSQTFTFQKKVTGICGINGVGKTNLLDAVWYLCFTKSYFSTSESQISLQQEAGFRLEGHFNIITEKAKVAAIYRETGKKEISYNDVLYTRFSGHIGKLPAVMVAPDDVDIITGGSEKRRKLIDTLFCQLSPDYMQHLINYNRVLQQRNGLLKQTGWQPEQNETLLQVYNTQLVASGSYIFESRKKFLAEYLQKATAHYKTIAQSNENVQLAYNSQLLANIETKNSATHFNQMLINCKSTDYALKRSTFGIHRDDIQILLNSRLFSQTASQGQRKCLLFALKLTEFEMLEQYKQLTPILLLDDVFEKLDHHRMTNLLTEACLQKNGQVIITDTHRQRLKEQLEAIGCDYEIIDITQ